MAMTQDEMKKLSPSELCSHLIDALGDSVSGSVLDSLEEQRVSGASFLNLRDEDLREVASLLGDRVTLRNYIDSFKASTKSPSGNAMSATSSTPSTWLHTFKLPERFSRATTEAIERGEKGDVTKKMRIEIVNMIAFKMLEHTERPTSEEYTVVSRMLITKHPVLKDSVGNGYGSWKEQLRTKFKNIRRPQVEKRPRERESESEEETVLAPKRARGGKVIMTDEEIKSYEEKAERLAQECAKEKPKKKRVKRLMESTHLGRRAWVENELPRVSEVLQKFPPLKQPKHMWREFTHIVEADTEEVAREVWAELQDNVQRVAHRESRTRKGLQELLQKQTEELSAIDDELEAELKELHIIEQLHILVAQRNKTGAFIKFSEENLDEQVAEKNINYPYIAVINMDFSMNMFLVVEREIVCSIKSVFQAVQLLLSAYYVFNISYPKLLGGFFVFLKCYVFKLKAVKEKLPVSVTQLCSVLDVV